MNEKLLIDTNIMVYAVDEDSRFHERAQRLIYESDDELFTTSKNLSEFLAVVTKGQPPPLSPEEALNALLEISEAFTVLYPTNYTFVIFQNLILKYQPTGLRIHDFEIASIGLGNGINRLATLNRKDFAEIEELELIGI
ncbi:PIN domain-containing protein [candidate division KSB1 bacterium]|nr:PIN domain-containing protein [candidate division KSB1 bacterium]